MNTSVRTLLLVLLAVASTSARAQRPDVDLSPMAGSTTHSAGSGSLEGMRQRPDSQGPVFIENRGQWDRRVRFLLRSGGLDTWITDHGVVYDLYQVTPATTSGRQHSPQLGSSNGADRQKPQRVGRRGHVVAIDFLGAMSAPTARGEARRPGHHNYFIGNDPGNWATNVALYGGARIEGVYPGIDAVFYLDAGRPRYDLVVAPGADPSEVRMSIEGATSIGVTPGGSLSIATSVGAIEQRELYAYQEIGGARQRVSCRFVVDENHEVRFDLGSYDRRRPLVIDPLIYSTYLGGSNQDQATAIAIDGSGNAYVAGHTQSTNFPTSGAYQSSYGGDPDAFVTKLGSNGSTLSYSTYLGGSNHEVAYEIAVDGSGNAYVTGTTHSTNFPTSGAFQSANGGSGGTGDAFVTKLNSGGGTLAFSTYLGGSSGDNAAGIAVDASGSAYITGYTSSTNFPTSGAYQSAKSGDWDAFVTKLGSAGNTLVYSTYLGGSNDEYPGGIAVDASGNAYITGGTYSSNFPTSGAYQSSFGGSVDAFITKIDSDGSTLVFSTYLGGISIDHGSAIAVDGSDNAYVCGHTGSTDFPTSGAYQSSYGGGSHDGFVTKLNSSGGTIAYSTYLGGSGLDIGIAIAVDGSGNAHVCGSTGSTNFPTSAPYQSSIGGANDAFVTKLVSDGSTLAYSTYLGGSSDDAGGGLAVDASGDVCIAGSTNSASFPTVGAYQSAYGGNSDAFIAKIGDSEIGTVAVTAPNGGESWCAGSTQSITWSSSGVTDVAIELSSDGGSTFPVTITAGTPAAAGSYAWTIPNSQAAGSSYRIRVSDAANGAVVDAGDASFSVVNSAPTLSVSLSPAMLWPANNTMRTITIKASAGDDCGSASWVLESVTGDDGATDSDWSYTPNSSPASFQVRARRTGSGSGRTYTATFVATDGGGNSSAQTATIFVPHSQGSKPSVSERGTVGSFSSRSVPNPFSERTEICYRLTAMTTVRVTIVSILGEPVVTVVDGVREGGDQSVVWDGRDAEGRAMESGRYVYRIDSDGRSETGSIILVR